MKALVGAFNQEKALVGAFSVIVQPVVEPMEHCTALLRFDDNVSFIEATSPEMEAEARLKSDLASFKVRTRALDLVTPGHTDVVLAEM